jgi:hypothetical protein
VSDSRELAEHAEVHQDRLVVGEHAALARHHDVGRLEVAVDDAVFVRHGQAARRGPGHRQRVGEREAAASQQPIDALSVDVRVDQDEPVLLVDDVEDRQDVRRRQLGREGDLRRHALAHRGIRRRHDLDRDVLVGRGVGRSVDGAGPSSTQHLAKHVPPDSLAQLVTHARHPSDREIVSRVGALHQDGTAASCLTGSGRSGH